MQDWVLPYLLAMPNLGPNQSIEGGFLTPSELVLLRIPVSAGSQLLEASTTAGTGVPRPSQLQYYAFVCSITPHLLDSPLKYILSFHCEGGAVDGYNATNETIKQSLIPLPPLSSTFPTPRPFGPQLGIGGWVDSKDAILSVLPVRFELLRSAKLLGNWAALTHRNALSADTPHSEEGPSGSGSRRTGLRSRVANETQDGNATDMLSDAFLIPEVESAASDEDWFGLTGAYPSVMDTGVGEVQREPRCGKLVTELQ